MDSTIKHSGYIIKEDDNQFYVQIQAESACSACHAKGYCPSSEKVDKIIDIQKKFAKNAKVGEFVTIEMNQSTGTKAVVIAYILPFLVMIFTFVISNFYISNQGIVGLMTLASILPYYLIVWMYRKDHKDKFEFRIV